MPKSMYKIRSNNYLNGSYVTKNIKIVSKNIKHFSKRCDIIIKNIGKEWL